MQYEVLNPLGSWFSRYLIYIMMYNSAGKFSTINVETSFQKNGVGGIFPPAALAASDVIFIFLHHSDQNWPKGFNYKVIIAQR